MNPKLLRLYAPVLLVLVALHCPLPARSQTLAARQTDIRQEKPLAQKQSLREALLQLRQQYQVDIVFDDELVHDLDVDAGIVNSTLSIDEKLTRMLQASGLRFKKTRKDIYLVLAPKPDRKIGTILLESPQPGTNHHQPLTADEQSVTESPAAVTVTGRVTDNNNLGLPGVSVVLKGTTTGTATDSEGKYALSLPDNQANGTLVFSFIGYTTEEVPISNRTAIDVQLLPDIKSLNEVVVVGYGTQKREQITSAIASVKAEDFVKGSVTDAAQLIRGKVPGLAITVPDGNPASTSQISIRGMNTINSGTGPLVLIDGVPGTLTTVAPEDIESVDVLRDGSAAAIYGTRGNNGVILITTKKVKGETPPTVDINTYFTTQSITRRLDFMNADQYRQIAVGHPGAVDYGASTNWLDEVLQTPFSQVYNVSLRGGTRSTQYIANLNYRNLEGIIQQSDNKVFYPRFEVIHDMFNGKVKLNGTVSAYQQTLFSGADPNTSPTPGINSILTSTFNGGVYRNALNYNPTDQPKDANGNWIEHVDRTDYANPVALLRETIGKIQNTNLRTYGTISYFPIDDLQIMLLGSRDLNNGVRGYSESRKHYSTRRDGRNGYASRGTTRQVEDMVELTGQYNKTLNEHQLTALAGYSWRETTYENYHMQNWDFPTDNYSYNNMGAGLALTRGQAVQVSYQSQNKLLSAFFRLNYSFRDKYLLMASIRREGSSKFGANNKWGNFPAVSAGWNIQKEAFMQSIPVVSTLKVRAGFGVTGTEPNSPYQSLNRLGFGTNTYYNGQWIQTVAPVNNANPDLKWETKEETNIGLDFGVLRNRISGSVDLYRRTTKDLLVDYPVPTPPYLFSTLLANAAVMENKGLEVQLNATPVETAGFLWTTSLNFSTNRNRIVSLSDENFSIASGYFDRGNTYEPIQQPISRVQIGQPIGNFFGYKSLDIDEDGRWIIEGRDGEPKPIANQQNDDKQILGNGMPKHYLSWNNTLVYKNFDLNITMRGAFGFQILNITRMYYGVPVGLNRGNVFANAFDNVYGKRPLADNQELQYVSYYVEDGDYWKIDNVTLGYNLGLKNKVLKNIRVYVSGNNLATFTGYSGIDPEISASYDGDFLVPGVDSRNRYPATASYTAGASFTF